MWSLIAKFLRGFGEASMAFLVFTAEAATAAIGGEICSDCGEGYMVPIIGTEPAVNTELSTTIIGATLMCSRCGAVKTITPGRPFC